MLRFMPGVQVPYFNPRLSYVLELASIWAIWKRIPVDINALGDRQHSANSLHPWGLAADLDTDGDKPEDLAALYGFLARSLPSDYDVINEGDHVHVEFDPHRKPTAISPPAAIVPPPLDA